MLLSGALRPSPCDGTTLPPSSALESGSLRLPTVSAMTQSSTSLLTRSSASTGPRASSSSAAPRRRRKVARPKADRAAAGDVVRGRGSFLRRSTVGGPTLRRYALGVEDFEKWCKDHHIRLTSHQQIDRAMERYFDMLFADGHKGFEGRAVLFGWILLRTDFAATDKTAFAGARKALAGWLKRTPGRMRDPVPEEIVWLIGTRFLEKGWVDSAAALTIQMDGYLRPSEVLTLKRAQVLRPSPTLGGAYNGWGLVLAPQEGNLTTKTGQTDDTVMLGDLPGRLWVRRVLERLADRDELFPALSLATYERHFREATRELGLTHLRITPHSIRHSGPSNDRLRQKRSLASIKKRGRWGSDKSVTRYEKHARLLLQLMKTPAIIQSKAKKTTSSFPNDLLAAV